MLPEGPEHRDERDQDQEICQRLEVLALRNFLEIIFQTGGWKVNKLLPSHPEDHGRDQHQNPRRAKRDIRPMELRDHGIEPGRCLPKWHREGFKHPRDEQGGKC